MESQNQVNQNGQVLVPIGQFSGTFRAKREIYMAMQLDCGAYLPQYEDCSVYWLKSLISGEKSCKYNPIFDHFV